MRGQLQTLLHYIVNYRKNCYDNCLDFRGLRGSWLAKLGTNKFQERLSGTSRMQETLFAAGALPCTPLGKLTVPPT